MERGLGGEESGKKSANAEYRIPSASEAFRRVSGDNFDH
jgi:hypothetical protein